LIIEIQSKNYFPSSSAYLLQKETQNRMTPCIKIKHINQSHMSRSAARTTRSKNCPIENFKSSSPREVKQTEFFLEVLSAKSVRLAADFSDREKFPLEMSKSENGIWRVVVPLASGNYSYRFIVDGQWCDDPHCVYRIPNSFGPIKATRKVA
jgi:1,4-alpha-glucan branching enzyme